MLDRQAADPPPAKSHSNTNSLTDTALSAGYYYQAHFIKDFKGFTGQPPGQFFRDSQYW